jgi:hypothetical protein
VTPFRPEQLDDSIAAAARLGRAAQFLDQHGDDELRIVAAALNAFLNAGLDPDDGGDLESLLGIKCRVGQRSWRMQLAIARRDNLLHAAAKKFYPNEHIGSQAEQISEALYRYAAGAWLRERGLEECPRRYVGRIQELLWAIMKTHPQTLSSRRIRFILSA